jgi:rhamnose utilization protein RhaD (predicted bifunctional aldolase and dehydrogenase)
MKLRKEKLEALIKLSHELANPLKPLAILGEGNTSARLTEKTFLVKASGSCLGSLREEDVAECKADVLLRLLDSTKLSDAKVDGESMQSRVNFKAKSRRPTPCSMPGF